METTERDYKIPVIIGAIVLIIGLSVYFVTREEEKPSVESEIERVQQELADARQNLEQEREELAKLMANLRNSAPAYAHASDHVDRLEKAIKQTDRMFIGANSTNPKLSVSTTFVLGNDINSRRAQINLLLKNWRNKVNVAVATQVTRATLNELKVDAEVIILYVRELEAVIKTATPENSGLTQRQIDDYLRSLVSIQLDIQATIDSLEEILARNPDFPPANNPPTSQEIIDQEAEVEVAEDEVEQLEEELEDLTGETWTWEDDEVEYVDPLTRDDTVDENYTGPPRLIEYSNDLPEQ